MTARSRVTAGALIVGRLALLGAAVLSAGCNAILGIDEPPAPPADAASDAGAADPDVGIDVDSGRRVTPDATGVDTYAPSDRRDTDVHEGGSAGADAGGARDGGNMRADGGDSGPIGDSGTTGGDGWPIGGDGGDAGPRIVVLRGTISTIQLAPAAAGNVRLVDQRIAAAWKSCNASKCVSGGIAP